MSASANKLGNLEQKAESYAALIMEKLDPDHLGLKVKCLMCFFSFPLTCFLVYMSSSSSFFL